MNWLAVETITPPVGAVFTTAEARAQVRVLHDAEDDLIDRLVAAATRQVERSTGTRLLTQTVLCRADSFTGTMRLPVGPVQEITAINYIDENGDEQLLDASIWLGHLAGLDPRLELAPGAVWPAIQARADAVRIEIEAGYGDALDVPENVGQAILLLVGHWYQNREATVTGAIVAELPMGVKALLHNDRLWSF